MFLYIIDYNVKFDISTLFFQITKAAAHDGGNYTCAPHNIHPDSVLVNIMDGEGKSAAVHRDEASSSSTANLSLIWLLTQMLLFAGRISENKIFFIL